MLRVGEKYKTVYKSKLSEFITTKMTKDNSLADNRLYSIGTYYDGFKIIVIYFNFIIYIIYVQV